MTIAPSTQSVRMLMQASAWARHLSPQDLQQVVSETIARDVPAGGYVCRKGEAVDSWIGVIDGLVKMTSLGHDGRTTTLTGVPTGGWFGEGSLLKPEPRRYDVLALRDSRIAYMPRATFMRLLDTNIGFTRFLLEQLNERLGQFIGLVETERMLRPDARVARCLGALFNPVLYPGMPTRIAISQEEIGFLAGVSRQRVNQALRALVEAGLIRLDYGGVTILDLAGLQRFGTG